jgi:hypothetical protein
MQINDLGEDVILTSSNRITYKIQIVNAAFRKCIVSNINSFSLLPQMDKQNLKFRLQRLIIFYFCAIDIRITLCHLNSVG